MKKLKFVSPSGIIVSTVKLSYVKMFETMIFNSRGEELFCRRYPTESEATKFHNYYVKQITK